MPRLIMFGVAVLFLAGICRADEWQTRAPIPTARGYAAAVEVDGEIYVIGGDVSGGGSFTGANEKYDPVSDSWTTMAPMPTARCLQGLAEVNGKIYAIGGLNDFILRTNEEYDPATDTWTTRAPMPSARSGAGVVAVNGKIYVIGGHPGFGFLDTNEEYDPASDTWTTKAPMPTPRAYLGATVVNDKIYTIGGIGGPIPGWYNMSVNEEYDPSTDSWVTRNSMSTARHHLLAAAVNDKIYAIGGWLSGPGDVLNINEEYDPVGDSWIDMAPMPTARTATGAGTGGRLYVISGFGSGILDGPLDINEEYTPYSPPVTVRLLPYDPPIQVPVTGGSFDYNVAVTNNMADPTTFDGWITVTLPDGSQFGPVLGPINLTLPGGASLDRDRTQDVPGGAPAGTYNYDAYVGIYPDEVWDSDGFPFEKLETGEWMTIYSADYVGEEVHEFEYRPDEVNEGELYPDHPCVVARVEGSALITRTIPMQECWIEGFQTYLLTNWSDVAAITRREEYIFPHPKLRLTAEFMFPLEDMDEEYFFHLNPEIFTDAERGNYNIFAQLLVSNRGGVQYKGEDDREMFLDDIEIQGDTWYTAVLEIDMAKRQYMRAAIGDNEWGSTRFKSKCTLREDNGMDDCDPMMGFWIGSNLVWGEKTYGAGRDVLIDSYRVDMSR